MSSITPQNRNGKIIGYRTSLGRGPNGKDRRKFHKTHADAQAYISAEEAHNIGSAEIYHRKAEITFCLQRLTAVGATLDTATNFYLKHGAKNGNPLFANLVTSFIKDKEQVGRKGSYLAGLKDKFEGFGNYVGDQKKIGDITSEEIKDYIFVTRKALNDTTKSDYIRALSILFNYAIKNKFLSINPAKNVERPTKKFTAPKVLSPDDFTILLNRCLKKGWKERVAVFVLVGFCGVRTQEACQLEWSNISMEAGRVMVPAEIAKKARFRRNDIPKNAMKWLEAIYDKRRTGPIIGPNAKRLLNTAVRFAHIAHTQNCIRHSFCSYALEAKWDLADVVAFMGHNGSPAMINSHYRNVVEPEAAKKWWSIVPPTT